MRALYYEQVEADIKVMMVTQVSDVMWASKPGREHLVGEGGSFRFCAR